MPQPKNQKRRNAIAGYEKAIDGWYRNIVTYQANPSSKEAKAFEEEALKKIGRLVKHIEATRAKLPYGGA